MYKRHLFGLFLVLGLMQPIVVWAGPDRPTEFTNMNSIINTRHNMTQRNGAIDLLAGGPNSGGAAQMDTSRNDYGEICVYCHTPHGANTSVAVPLWNRKIVATSYATYDTLGTSSIDQTYSQPGAASLSCLSCHDGQQAVDAIMNMPGSGNYSPNPDFAFAETWQPGGYSILSHLGLNSAECLLCHVPTGFGATIGTKATDFTVFALGTDLTNDHPVGVTYPAATGGATGWNTAGGTKGTTKFFDENGDGKMQKNEIRLYNSGGGPEVECATCHDPHGVPSAGLGSTFNKTFMRKTNTGSAVCLTCHAK